MNRAAELRELTRGYLRRRRGANGLLVAGCAIASGGAARAAGSEVFTAVPIACGVAAAAAIALWGRDRRTPVTPVLVARQLNRLVPALEESGELLLQEPTSLPTIERMQYRRVESSLGETAPLPRPTSRQAGRRAAVGAALMLAGLTLMSIPRPAAGARAGTATHAPATVRVGEPRIRVEPPAYTGLPPETGAGWDLDVADGSVVTWTIPADAERLRLATTRGDTIVLDRRGATFEGSVSASMPMLYQVLAEAGGARVESEFHRLAVRSDLSPEVTITEPRGRVVLRAAAHLTVPVDVRVSDDYGISSTRLVATLTSGEGEAVKFREQVFPLTRIGPDTASLHGLLLHTTLDLTALGLKPGDELYFHAEAADTRRPVANVGRSETAFITIPDTTHAPVSVLAGLALHLEPEFFRSERQIILDTEKLIADRAGITAETFRNRSNNIGLDQGLLRARYGQFVGDESESGENGEAAHQHDTPENGTLLAASVKEKLKQALAQMWAAELQLRSYRPVNALPAENRALTLLKEAQQSERVYVRRVGFESTPLDAGRTRLTGKLDAITSRTEEDSLHVTASLPAVRAALLVLSRLGEQASLGGAELLILDRAEAELAPLAAKNPADLPTLRWLRALADSSRVRRPCDRCAARATAGLLRILPPAPLLPALDGSSPSPLVREYFDRLGERR